MKEINFWTFRLTLRNVTVVGLTCIIAWLFTYLATYVYEDYAFGLFIWLPFVIGATSTLIHGYRRLASRKELRNVSYFSLLVFCLGLLFFAWEGVICLIMAAPIGLFFTWLGHRLGYSILKNKVAGTPTIIVLLFISVPSLMAFENTYDNKQELRSVKTSVEINASPEQVWEHVITFRQLKEPTEFIFKTGIAYPINATIKGQGVGAVRHCNFSTGSFVEPITVWQRPTLLKFSVVSQPEPLKELSFYDVHPNHLNGYWVSKQGQFRLKQLQNGHTLLEGTTWYENKIRPSFYWSIWSDYIVHKIHTRVLKHIKAESEQQNEHIWR